MINMIGIIGTNHTSGDAFFNLFYPSASGSSLFSIRRTVVGPR